MLQRLKKLFRRKQEPVRARRVLPVGNPEEPTAYTPTPFPVFPVYGTDYTSPPTPVVEAPDPGYSGGGGDFGGGGASGSWGDSGSSSCDSSSSASSSSDGSSSSCDSGGY